MPKMIFSEDKHVDGKLFARKGHPVEVHKDSVDRWVKRGGSLAVDVKASDEVVEAELDASLAVELEKEGKGTHEEVVQAIDKAEDVEAEDEKSGKKSSRTKSR